MTEQSQSKFAVAAADDGDCSEFVALTDQVEILADARALTFRALVSKASVIAEWLAAEFDDPGDLQDKAVFSVLKDVIAIGRRLDTPDIRQTTA